MNLQGNKDQNVQPLPQQLPKTDMPGDKVGIYDCHKIMARSLFPELEKMVMQRILCHEKTVISIFGGSGSGKSGTAVLLGEYFQMSGLGCYVLSGDNYPRRIPVYNDGERLHIFRENGMIAMTEQDTLTEKNLAVLRMLQEQEIDSDPAQIKTYPWLDAYIKKGREALGAYLGSDQEIDYGRLNHVIRQFKKQEPSIWLKRMGRTSTQLWYEKVDFSNIDILILEWTHGGSPLCEGTDLSVLLSTTPEETKKGRLLRGRDPGADSPFVTMVLQLEQEKINASGGSADLIVTQDGRLLSRREFDAYSK